MKEELIAELNNFRTERLIRSKQIKLNKKNTPIAWFPANFFSGQSRELIGIGFGKCCAATS
jgi:hypothetical protein